MAKFRVLHGLHSEGGRVYDAGSVVDSKSNLLRFNQPGAVKFQALPDSTLLDSTPVSEPDTEPTDLLENMTVADLRKLAEEEEINLDGTTRKDQIVAAIRAATQPRGD